MARNYIEGHPLGNREVVNETFYPALCALLRSMHERKIAYVDLHKRENILVNERGEPCLIDFQISVAWPSWLPPGPLFALLRRGDEYHLMKHWSRSRPEQCGIDEVALRRANPLADTSPQADCAAVPRVAPPAAREARRSLGKGASRDGAVRRARPANQPETRTSPLDDLPFRLEMVSGILLTFPARTGRANHRRIESERTPSHE